HDSVAYGSRVVVEDEQGDTLSYEIVFPEEVDAAKGQISLSSPIGRALLNKVVGDEVEVQTPGGKRTYQIVELQTLHERKAAPAADTTADGASHSRGFSSVGTRCSTARGRLPGRSRLRCSTWGSRARTASTAARARSDDLNVAAIVSIPSPRVCRKRRLDQER